MNIRSKLLLLAGLSLAACAEMPAVETAPNGAPFIAELPESVRAIAASNQNLDRVVILEDDNCYWYEHAGPVETTLLPLRTTRGNTICVETPTAPAAAPTPAPAAPAVTMAAPRPSTAGFPSTNALVGLTRS